MEQLKSELTQRLLYFLQLFSFRYHRSVYKKKLLSRKSIFLKCEILCGIPLYRMGKIQSSSHWSCREETWSLIWKPLVHIPQSSSSIMALADAQEGGLETDHSIATVRPGNTALGHNSHLHLGIISDGWSSLQNTALLRQDNCHWHPLTVPYF